MEPITTSFLEVYVSGLAFHAVLDDIHVTSARVDRDELLTGPLPAGAFNRIRPLAGYSVAPPQRVTVTLENTSDKPAVVCLVLHPRT